MDFFPKKNTGSYRCEVCDVTVNSEVQLVQHRTGKTHLRKMRSDLPADEAGRGFRGKDEEEMDPITQAVVNNALGKLATKRKATPKKWIYVAGFRFRRRKKKKSNVNNSDNTTTAQVTCSHCNRTFNSEAQAAQHYNGLRHAKKVKMVENTKNMETDEDSPDRDTNGEDLGKKLGLFFCSLCNISVNSMQQLEAHKSGNKHGNKMQKLDGKCLDDKDGDSLECKDDD
ncbi:zinc finger protein 346 isoform X1 [Octopus bimaculoides]|nr:zinc finger protein 346 isoform X1 [Octopus bimaculoides]XP_029634639.1 zinc finger protein 346 isoform X2 [Octopus sinensis]XP_036358219.1 zinc finger protein 346 isoform X2 [Octopus sinensis]XP_036358220.1 zinc finger protein 346 isoform X2 [Octopus sinensis]XP_036358221.1 zinc finger protein 346 isoform X2 [Octopus sinensis]XP_036358222.1 zinc finger protein 346 isoform X2 [Octopus sinensis]XP_052823558.1 zinc finger protein 346 isoform X1 [Octopus bimaculoides]XP_052823559.1 zinc fing|eukprot:XP_014791019.1 PREDICTED: zinc finger protein 346-like [Octopus bimaculoides]